jgi:hypothetical protein
MYKLFFAMLIVLSISDAAFAAKDAVPDNCENQRGRYYQQNIFPRYEPQNKRLVLVDWSTGKDTLVLANGLDDTRILGWSVDCRYLAAAVGAPDSMDTAVWDTTTAGLIGKVPGAHLKPHHITWGPDNYLVVETRAGAILWNVPANSQTILTTSFDTFSVRNFSRLRWNADKKQLFANLAVGGRVAYDLKTGQEIPYTDTAALTDDNYAKTIVIGGKQYPCEGNYVSGVYLSYDTRTQTVFLSLDVLAYFYPRRTSESLLVLEDKVRASTFQARGWSADCRYAAASVGIPGRNATDTVVWDIVERRRVGVFPDARQLPHVIHWAADDDALLIETRGGGYLWYLPTNTRTLLTTQVETAVTGRPFIRNFTGVKWENGQVRVAPVGSPKVERIYAVRTGNLIGEGPYAGKDFEYPYTYSDFSWVEQQPLLPAHRLPGITGMSGKIAGYGWWRWWSNFNAGDCNGLTAGYDARIHQTRLLNSKNRAVVRLLAEDAHPTSDFEWSPDCRYLSARVYVVNSGDLPYDDAPLDDTYRERLSYDVVFWDAQTGRQLAVFPRPYRAESPAAVVWSPGSERALVRTTQGYFLWNPAVNQKVLLVYDPRINLNWDGIKTYFQTYWDFQRGQVLISGWEGVYAFDINTGKQRYLLAASPRATCDYGGCYFSVSPDNNLVYVGGGTVLGIWIPFSIVRSGQPPSPISSS